MDTDDYNYRQLGQGETILYVCTIRSKIVKKHIAQFALQQLCIKQFAKRQMNCSNKSDYHACQKIDLQPKVEESYTEDTDLGSSSQSSG